jgi:hypothetical protein
MKTSHPMENTHANENTLTKVSVELSKVSVAFIAITAGVIGCWATASLFAGTISSGGPIGLIQNFITALVG